MQCLFAQILLEKVQTDPYTFNEKNPLHFCSRKSDGRLLDVFIDSKMTDGVTGNKGLENRLFSEGGEVNGEFRHQGT